MTGEYPLGWALPLCLLACGCEGRPQHTEPRERGGRPGVVATLEFEGEGRIEVLEVRGPGTPGGTVTLELSVEPAAADTLVATLWPPRLAGRELALGAGVTAEMAAMMRDERVVERTVAAVSGPLTLELPLAQPWHPTAAVVTLELRAGDRPLAATAGPRSRSGLAQATVVSVPVQPTRVLAQRASQPPVVDGVLQESLWAGPGVALVESLDGEPSRPASTLWFAWDPEYLYAAAHFDDADVWSEFTADDQSLWEQEAFELFLLGAANRQGYLELQVSPRGRRFDARFAQYRRGDVGWNGTWRSAVAVDGTLERRDDRDRGWTVEMAVPWAEACAHVQVECTGAPGMVTRINAFRLDRPAKSPVVAQALSPTREPDFHRPDNAAILELLP